MSRFKSRKWPMILLQLILFIGIVGGGLLSARHFMETRPSARKSRPAQEVPLVSIEPVRSTSRTAVIQAMGTVVSAREISLQPELSGTVAWVSPGFVPGGTVKQGEVLIRLDTADYELEVKNQQALVRKLQADMAIEAGQQEVARREMELMQASLKRTIKDPSLALRQPQMQKVQASLESQQISLEKAQLNLQRTVIRAPFNAMILNRSVEVGSRISTQTPLASLTSTDAFWIEAAVPVNKLRWLKVPELNGSAASRAKVRLQDGSTADGQVVRLLGNLGEKSQMARLLVSVSDPLGMQERKGQLPLLLNSYVSLELSGEEIHDVVPIPRSAVRDGNRIWLYQDRQLRIRTIKPVWEDEDSYYVRHIVQPGELLITSEISTAVEGMAVRIPDPGTAAVKIADQRQGFPVNQERPRPENNTRPQGNR